MPEVGAIGRNSGRGRRVRGLYRGEQTRTAGYNCFVCVVTVIVNDLLDLALVLPTRVAAAVVEFLNFLAVRA